METKTYSRVSTDRQEHEATIESQAEELRTRVRDDGITAWEEIQDQGYSRDNLVRPGLDRLRDLAAQGEVDRVYIQAPDRLASGAKLMVLVDELQSHGVSVIFLTGATEDTPEGRLLLHVQGAIAEYERTKIAERTRRGKLYWARAGALVGGHHPYGYRFVRRVDLNRAHLEIEETTAPVVRSMYQWLINEQLSTRAVARRLMELGVPTPRGAQQWQPHVIARMLRNTAYKGVMHYGKTERVVPDHPQSADKYRQNRKSSARRRAAEEWITIPVPAIVDEQTWQTTQDQLDRNALLAPRNNKRHQYLLRGLIRCPRCGGNYVGQAKGGHRNYRCNRTDWEKSSTGQRCSPGSVKADLLEEAVWDAVTGALRRPDLLRMEYERRLSDSHRAASLESERGQLRLAFKRISKQEERLTAAYMAEALDLGRFKQEMDHLKTQRIGLERSLADVDQREKQASDAAAALARLDDFCEHVAAGLDAMTFIDKQQLLRLVVERIVVDEQVARIETIIPPPGTPELGLGHGEPPAPSSGAVAAGILRTRHPERSEESLTPPPERFSRRRPSCGRTSQNDREGGAHDPGVDGASNRRALVAAGQASCGAFRVWIGRTASQSLGTRRPRAASHVTSHGSQRRRRIAL